MPKPPPTSGAITRNLVSGSRKILWASVVRTPWGFCVLV